MTRIRACVVAVACAVHVFSVSCATAPTAPSAISPLEEESQASPAKTPIEVLTPVAAAAPQTPAGQTYWQDRSDLLDLPADPVPATWSWPVEETFTLPNGFGATLLPKPDEAVVTVALTLPAGHDAEPDNARGAASLLAGWLRAGSSRMNGRPLELRVEDLGASVSIDADRRNLVITCTSLQPTFIGCLNLVADLAQAPAFLDQSLVPVRTQLVNHRRQTLTSARGLAEAHFANQIFGDGHPAGRALLSDDLIALDESKIRAFWSAWFRPNLAHLVVVGNVARADLQRATNHAFGNWARGPVPKLVRPVLPQTQGLRIVVVDDPNATDAVIVFGHRMAPVSLQQRAALEALVFVFGGAGLGSRLALDVAPQGLIAAGVAALEEGPDDLVLRGTMQSPAAKVWPALLEAAQQLKDLADQGMSPAELAEAKARSAAVDPFALETGAGLAAAVARSKSKSVRTFAALADSVTRLENKDLRAAAKVLRPEHLTVVVVGPAARITPELQRAKVRFERVGLEEPISSGERAARETLAMTKGADNGSGEALGARTLIIKALAAQGGAPAWRALKTLKVVKHGQRREAGGVAKLVSTTYYARPNKVRVEQVASMGGNSAQGAFVVTPAGVRGGEGGKAMEALPQQNADSLRDAVFEDVIFLLLNVLDAKPSLPMQLTPVLQEGDTSYQGVLVRTPSGQWLKLFFHPETSLLARIRSPDGAGGESEQRLSDWRLIGGLKFPYRQLSVGGSASEATLHEVVLNPPLADELFR